MDRHTRRLYLRRLRQAEQIIREAKWGESEENWDLDEDSPDAIRAFNFLVATLIRQRAGVPFGNLGFAVISNALEQSGDALLHETWEDWININNNDAFVHRATALDVLQVILAFEQNYDNNIAPTPVFRERGDRDEN